MNRICASIVLTLSFAAAGCDDREASIHQNLKNEIPKTVTDSWPATQATDRGSFTVTVKPSHHPIERNRHFSMEVAVEIVAGTKESTEINKVGVDADMPAHRHGMNTKPEIAKTGDGNYRIDGMLFHMAGEWVIAVEVDTGTGSERASFLVEVE